jgi:hypothetical protein
MKNADFAFRPGVGPGLDANGRERTDSVWERLTNKGSVTLEVGAWSEFFWKSGIEWNDKGFIDPVEGSKR